MNKKQKNRKIVTQTNRNRIINRRYTSTIKTLSKLFNKKIKNFATENNTEINSVEVNDTKKVIQSLTSLIDKAVKKRILHKNTAARKKSKIDKIFKHNIKILENSLKS